MAENEVLSDAERFSAICGSVSAGAFERSGIGTLGEKSVHRTLKYFVDDRQTNHEIPICGFVADVYNESGIHEIQTSGFSSLRRKLEAYLSLYPVEIIYPVIAARHVIWVSPESGDVVREYNSPRHESPAEIFCELLYIADFLESERLSFAVAELWCDEVRLCDGYGVNMSCRATKVDIIPKRLVAYRKFASAAELGSLLPYKHGERFTGDELKRKLHSRGRAGWAALKILEELCIIKRVGKSDRKILYEFEK